MKKNLILPFVGKSLASQLKSQKKNDGYQKIESFTTCRRSYQIFSYTSTTDTRNMLAHSCLKNLSNTKITTFTSSSSSTQVKLNNMMKIYKNKVKLREKELDIAQRSCLLMDMS